MNMMLLMILKIITSLAFILAGGAKLLKLKPSVAQFHDFRLPLEIMYLVGVFEIIGAIALWFDILTLWAFSGLGFLMIGAMNSHAKAKHPFASFVPALILFILCLCGVFLVQWLN